MQDPTQNMHFLALIVGAYLVFIVLALIAVIVPTWFICKKAGFSPWLSLLNIVPIGGLVLLYILAFSEWKVTPTPQAAYLPPQPPYPPQPPLA